MTDASRFHGSSDLALTVERHRDAILARLTRSGASNVRIFGSVGRGTDGPGSDVDLLVDFTSAPSLWELAELEDDLAHLVGAHVDVVEARALRHTVRSSALREAVAV